MMPRSLVNSSSTSAILGAARREVAPPVAYPSGSTPAEHIAGWRPAIAASKSEPLLALHKPFFDVSEPRGKGRFLAPIVPQKRPPPSPPSPTSPTSPVLPPSPTSASASPRAEKASEAAMGEGAMSPRQRRRAEKKPSPVFLSPQRTTMLNSSKD